MKSGDIRKLVEGGVLQIDLFDERNLLELVHPDYPGERLVACRNPLLARKRAYKRKSMLEATERELSKIRTSLNRGTLKKTERTKEKIGVRVGKVVNKYKMAKHVILHINDNRFDFEMNEENIAAEAALDDGTPAHSFKTLLDHMSTITRDFCVQKIPGAGTVNFTIDTTPNPKQQRVYDLLSDISV